jgi:hypothetical protein
MGKVPRQGGSSEVYNPTTVESDHSPVTGGEAGRTGGIDAPAADKPKIDLSGGAGSSGATMLANGIGSVAKKAGVSAMKGGLGAVVGQGVALATTRSLDQIVSSAMRNPERASALDQAMYEALDRGLTA